MKQLILLLVFIFLISALTAVPYTVLGNINIPDAYVLPHKMMEFSYSNYFVEDPQAYNDEDMHYNFAGVINAGLFNRGEIGIVFGSNDIYYCNAKIKIINETQKVPSLAFGFDNIFSQYKDTDENKSVEDLSDRSDYIKNSPYIILSKSTLVLLNLPYMDQLEMVFHLGVGSRKYRGKGEIVKNFAGIFGGADFRFSQIVGTNFEFDGENFNMGINLYYSNFTFNAGLFEIEDYFGVKGDYSSKLAFNLKYTLDSFSDIKAADKNKYMERIYPIPKDEMDKKSPSSESTETEDVLLEELKKISERRKEAEKELEEIRKLLQED